MLPSLVVEMGTQAERRLSAPVQFDRAAICSGVPLPVEHVREHDGTMETHRSESTKPVSSSGLDSVSS